MTRLRLIGILLASASLLALIGTLPVMVRRLAGRAPAMVWFNKPITQPRVQFLGEPVELVLPPVGEPTAGPRTIEIRWRGESVSFEIEEGMRDDPRLPGLLRFDDWLRVLIMAEGARDEEELEAGITSGAIRPRLIIAMRLPARDFPAGSWADVRRREWRYRFVELLPEAESPDEAFRVHEGTYHEIDRLGDPAHRAATGRDADAWMHYAMQHVTPPTLFRARNRPVEQAMRAMGWTWPVAGLSVLGVVAGIALAAAGRKA